MTAPKIRNNNPGSKLVMSTNTSRGGVSTIDNPFPLKGYLPSMSSLSFHSLNPAFVFVCLFYKVTSLSRVKWWRLWTWCLTWSPSVKASPRWDQRCRSFNYSHDVLLVWGWKEDWTDHLLFYVRRRSRRSEPSLITCLSFTTVCVSWGLCKPVV